MANKIELDAAKHRIYLFRSALKYNISFAEINIQLRSLREAIEGDIENHWFFYYPMDKSKLLKNVDSEWKIVIEKFSSAKVEIFAAVDCYALGHYTATIFYLMRMMEFAVQEFGKNLGVNFVKKNPGKRVSELGWEQILNELNPKLKAMSQKTAAQKRKHQKYSAVQSYLYGVKDAWRNPTMHPRPEGYDEPQARGVLNHVRSFMSEHAGIL